MKLAYPIATTAGAGLFLLAVAAACRDAVAPPKPSPTDLAFTAVDSFMPGRTATIRGRGFAVGLQSVEIDGHSVAVIVHSDTKATFVVPTLHACDVDGRRVAVRATAPAVAQVEAVLRAPNPVALAVGESKRLLPADLACLQIPGADHDYVITALNPSLNGGESLDAMFTLHALAGQVGPSTTIHAHPTTPTATRERRSDARLDVAAAVPPGYSPNPVLFDPRYATALAGDTVQFVDWQRTQCTPVSKPDRATAPRYAVLVLAVRGAVAIGLDLRHPNAAYYQTAEARRYVTDAAQIANSVLLQTMREVFDPAFNVPPAAAGRSFHIIAPPDRLQGATGLAFDGQTAVNQAYCPPASEMVTTLVSGGLANTTAQARSLASSILHEYAHNAEMLTKLRSGTYLTSASVWTSEPWAVIAEETGARIASGQPTAAQLTRLSDTAPQGGSALGTLWGMYPGLSPFTGAGNYSYGAALLLYLRERMGDAALGTTATRSFNRLTILRRMDLDSIARILNTTSTDLLDDFTLAHATDDLVSESAARAQHLPQLETWDTADRARDLANGWHPRGGGAGNRPDRTVSRREASIRAVGAASGNYFAAYIFADELRGISLHGEGFAARPAIIRLTRLR